jgi:Flp pilus assembly protein TadD
MRMDDFETAREFFFEGLSLLEANAFEAAEIKFEQSLKLMPDRVSTLNNLSAIKIKLKKFAEAEECARKAIALEDKSPEAWSNLGLALSGMERHEEALQVCDEAIKKNSSYAKGWLTKAMILLELKRYDEALLACDEALKLEPHKCEILYYKSLILKELDQQDEAQKIYWKSFDLRVASSPAFLAERRATQKANALILNPPLDAAILFKPLETMHRYCRNFPGQLVKYFKEEFHFTCVFVDATKPLARKQIPPPDFVINNHANGERVLSEGHLTDLMTLVDSFGVPVVNLPTKIIQSTRDMSVKLLDDLPGVLMPKTTRFSSIGKPRDEVVREIEDQYNYPFITRTLAAQMGKGMNKVDSRDALIQVLASGFAEKFFVTEFRDSRSGKNEFYRKIRGAIVQSEIVIVRVDYDTFWNVHGRKNAKRVPFYLENSYLLDEEKRICKDPQTTLGRAAMQSLHAIRKRIPLDVFGIDFDVNADGQVVFYEANATMNLFSTAQKEVPNPKEAEDQLKQVFQNYLTSLLARR